MAFHEITRARSFIDGRSVRQLNISQKDAVRLTMDDVRDLADIGIGFDEADVNAIANFAMDDNQGIQTTASVPTAVQFLQNWLPGVVRVVTAPRKIDEIVGIFNGGSWEDEMIVQTVLEPIGQAQAYGDYSNVPLATWNTNFVYRNVVRMEKGIKVGALEEARAARMRISSSAEKRNSAALSLEIARNNIGFYGYNSGNNLTFGLLNDPNLPAYQTFPATGTGNSTTWATKDTLQIIADIQMMAAQLQTQSNGLIDPFAHETTLVVPVTVMQYLATPTQFGYSVQKWIDDTYHGKMRIVNCPQFVGANGGASVVYLFAEKLAESGSDDERTFIQVVPAKFQALGVEKQAKAYVEDYTNATSGVLLKRPYLVTRFSGC